MTGASSGIGEATARLLAEKDWRCVLVARREDRLRTLADEIGGEVEVCDVGDREAVEAMAERVLERHPAIGLLLNNAGMPARGTFLTVDPDLVQRVIEVNYLGGVWCTRALLPGLKWGAADGGSHIVNLISVAGTVAFAPAGAVQRRAVPVAVVRWRYGCRTNASAAVGPAAPQAATSRSRRSPFGAGPRERSPVAGASW